MVMLAVEIKVSFQIAAFAPPCAPVYRTSCTKKRPDQLGTGRYKKIEQALSHHLKQR